MKKIVFVLMLFIFFSKTNYASSTQNIYDYHGLLSTAERISLQEKASRISNKYQIGIYVLIVENYNSIEGRFYGSLQSASENFYTDKDLGYGEDKDGLMLTLVMNGRKFWLLTHGNRGNKYFTDYARKDVIIPEFLDDFKKNNWVNGFENYFETSEMVLEYGYEHGPMDIGNSPEDNNWRIVFSLLGGVSAGVFFAYKKSMQDREAMDTALLELEASNYVSEGDFKITDFEDRYTHKDVKRVKVKDSSSDGDSGGGGGGGGFSGSGGDF